MRVSSAAPVDQLLVERLDRASCAAMTHHTSLFAAHDDHDEVGHRTAANHALAFSAVVLAAAGGVELLAALFTHSVGLLGDALHNLSDVSTSALVFFGFRISRRLPTARYPYGYERAEDLAGLAVAAVIWASAALAGWESYRKLVSHAGTNHLALGMAAAVIGIAANRVVAAYKTVLVPRSSRPRSSPTPDTPGSMRCRRSVHSLD